MTKVANSETELRESFNASKMEIRDELLEFAEKMNPKEVSESKRLFHCQICKEDIQGRFVILQVCRDMHQHRNSIIPDVFEVYCIPCWNKKEKSIER